MAKRAKPGSSGEGDFYHIEILPSSGFVTFRNQDVGEKGGLERVAGQRKDGSWETVKWLVEKKDAHVENGYLVPDNEAAENLFKEFARKPRRTEGDRFDAKKVQPTPAQTRARKANIKKAQAARRR